MKERDNMHEKSNRLINEKSPYLLQHANNPVEWFPWGEEAFNKAKIEDKPIFLSIGYSTCHWCHVMSRESFEDEEVAKVLNDSFISIKVDREERPDVDNIYMSVCQAMTGGGGWPLTVIMTPEKQPFFAGTYFPKNNKYGNPGLMELLDKISIAWQENKEELVEYSNDLLVKLKDDSEDHKGEFSKEIIDQTFNYFKKSFDPVFGGFGNAPKFPSPHNLTFLLTYFKATGEIKALDMVKTTLDNLQKGGIFDHLGGGFSRYSVDKKWFAPHFEKMIYDNALLAIAYLQTYQETGEERYKKVCEKIFNYILRDMTSSEGGFFCAEDADSEGEEGKFYLWTQEEIEEVLDKEEAKLFISYYGVSSKGNFEGKNILNLIGKDLDKETQFDTMRQKLFEYREKRIRPRRDDKILTSWNSLMIVALSMGARILKQDKYLVAAKNSMDFLMTKLVNKEGRVLARYCKGEAAYFGYLEDYAFLIWALIEMYETTFNCFYLEKALIFNKDMLKVFWDEKEKGLFIYGKDSEQLILKTKEAYDGAIPSGNSIAAMNMLRLSLITGDSGLEAKAKEIFSCFGGTVKRFPAGYTSLMSAYVCSQVPGKYLVIAGKEQEPDTRTMLNEVHKVFQPFLTVVLQDESLELEALIPNIKSNVKIDGKATAYICKNFVCSKPTVDIDEFIELLK